MNLGKGRNARRKKKRQKRRNDDKVSDREEATGDIWELRRN